MDKILQDLQHQIDELRKRVVMLENKNKRLLDHPTSSEQSSPYDTGYLARRRRG
jgi:hypothetical protein